MRTVQSAGGSLIAIRKDQSMSWLGSSGRSFTGDDGRFSTDYEAAGHVTSGENSPASTIGSLQGVASDGVVIAMPFETAIVRQQSDAIYIAQIEYGDPDWSFESLKSMNFDKIKTIYTNYFRAKCGEYIIFDAAYAGCSVGDDHLDFTLDEGEYILSYVCLELDENTGIILYAIKKSPYA